MPAYRERSAIFLSMGRLGFPVLNNTVTSPSAPITVPPRAVGTADRRGAAGSGPPWSTGARPPGAARRSDRPDGRRRAVPGRRDRGRRPRAGAAPAGGGRCGADRPDPGGTTAGRAGGGTGCRAGRAWLRPSPRSAGRPNRRRQAETATVMSTASTWNSRSSSSSYTARIRSATRLFGAETLSLRSPDSPSSHPRNHVACWTAPIRRAIRAWPSRSMAAADGGGLVPALACGLVRVGSRVLSQGLADTGVGR